MMAPSARSFRTLALVSVLVLLPAMPSEGAILHVPGDFATVCEATHVAEFGDTVLVAPGVHDYRFERCDPIPNGVAVVSEAGPEQTTLDAWQFGPIVGNGLIEFEPGAGPQTALTGFTIRYQDISGAPISAAIACIGASPVIARNVIRPASFFEPWIAVGIACADGAAPAIVNNTLALGDPRVPRNEAVGIYAWNSYPLISHNILTDCEVGIGCYGASELIVSCNDIWDVRLPYHGGCPSAEGDFFDDPRFCDRYVGDFTLDCTSPALHGYGCGLVGALAVGCGEPSATQRSSWTAIKVLFR